MNYGQLIKNIESKKWYRQGGELSFFYTFRPYKSIGMFLGFDNAVNTHRGRVNIAYFNRNAETAQARAIVAKVATSRSYIDDKIQRWHNVNGKMNRVLESKWSRVDEWSDEELVTNLDEATKLFLDCWYIAVTIEMFDPDGDKILAEVMDEEGVMNLKPEELAILTGPRELTYQQREFVERIKIVERAAMGKDVAQLIKKHQQKYFWIDNDWRNVTELSVDHFTGLVEDDQQNLVERRQEVQEIKKTLASNNRRRKEIIKKHKISDKLANVFYLFSRMSDWRDVRKQGICYTNHYFYQILKRLAEENGIDLDLVHFLNPWDISGWKLPAGIEDELKKREKGVVHLYGEKDDQWYAFYDKEATAIIKLLEQSVRQSELKGMCASQGVVEGVARVVETRADFAKVKPGDIIVATMTRPDYLPIMKIAGGIVTDEGGLTCHAAIVSRELKIPCIVGMQTATSEIPDGAKIRVDADKEKVKILN